MLHPRSNYSHDVDITVVFILGMADMETHLGLFQYVNYIILEGKKVRMQKKIKN